MTGPVIIQAAVTGAAADAAVSPHLPLTPARIVEEVVSAWRAGAAVVHIHAREADGTPTQSVQRYAEIVEGVRARGCDAVLNLSTGSAGGRCETDERFACLSLRPDMGSFDCGSTNFGDRVFENSPAFLRRLAQAFRDKEVAPEIECFDVGDLVAALRLRDEGLLSDPLRFQFVLGIRGGAPATLEQVLYMRSLVPPGALWSVCALGRMQLRMNVFALIAGGHVRTGLEDNVYVRKGQYATGNAQLVERVVRIASELDRPIATPSQARQLLGLARLV